MMCIKLLGGHLRRIDVSGLIQNGPQTVGGGRGDTKGVVVGAGGSAGVAAWRRLVSFLAVGVGNRSGRRRGYPSELRQGGLPPRPRRRRIGIAVLDRLLEELEEDRTSP